MATPKKGSEPPSLFDHLDLFSAEASAKGGRGAGEGAKGAPAPALSETEHLTGKGPLKDLYDFNFRHYSAYVICSRAIPAVEDG